MDDGWSYTEANSPVEITLYSTQKESLDTNYDLPIYIG